MTAVTRLERRREEVRDRFGLLLVLIVGSFLALGLAAGLGARLLVGILQLAAVVVAFAASGLQFRHAWMAVAGVAGIAAIVLSNQSSDVPRGLSAIASTIVLVLTLVAVLDRVLRHRRVTLQTLLGAVCAYFILGLAFGSLYASIDLLGSQPLFGKPVAASVYSYFSFTTLTTVGFGDLTAQPDMARRLVVIEAVLGQIFIATTLARLVSLYRSPSPVAATIGAAQSPDAGDAGTSPRGHDE